jgi:hypothetical protein
MFELVGGSEVVTSSGDEQTRNRDVRKMFHAELAKLSRRVERISEEHQSREILDSAFTVDIGGNHRCQPSAH